MAFPYSRSVPDILKDLLAQFTDLVRMEGQLARAEVSEKINRTAGGLVLVMIGAVLLIPALVVLLEAAVAALMRSGMAALWAALIVGGVALLIGIVLLLVGAARFKAKNLMPSRTVTQLQQDIAVAKHQMRQGHDEQRAA
jgi:hypothetical protein